MRTCVSYGITKWGHQYSELVPWGTAKHSNDGEFFYDNGFPVERNYFNAGVLLFDAFKWRKEEWSNKCLDFGQKYGRGLPTADQTILNCLLGNKFCQIPRRFNTPVSASRPKLDLSDIRERVIHLVYRPKPWDPLGFLHGQYDYFHSILQRTAISKFRQPWPNLRTIRLSRSYIKCLKNALLAVHRA